MFHRRCGDRVNLINNNSTAERNFSTYDYGRVLSAEPLKDDEIFEVRVDKKVIISTRSISFNPAKPKALSDKYFGRFYNKWIKNICTLAFVTIFISILQVDIYSLISIFDICTIVSVIFTELLKVFINKLVH